MILGEKHGATTVQASRHKQHNHQPLSRPPPPSAAPFVTGLLAAHFTDYVRPLIAPLAPLLPTTPRRRRRTSRYFLPRCIWPSAGSTARRSPVAAVGRRIPEAAYASLTLLTCLLLLLPPCADSLSRIRGPASDNVTRVAAVSSVTSQASAVAGSSSSCGWRGLYPSAAVLSPHSSSPSSSSSSSSSRAVDSNSAQCLVLNHDMAHEVCSAPVRTRRQKMRSLRLRFCDRYLLFHVVGSQCHLEGSEAQCRQCLADVTDLDAKARDMYQQFEAVLRVVEDCAGNFSTHWSCDDCKGAYRAWLCSTLVPYHLRGQVIAPCSRFCESVENRCPYFVPHADTQYAGEPSFLCRDTSIRFKLGHAEVETPVQTEACYGPCRMKKEATPKTNVNNYTMSSSESDNDNDLCYLKGQTSQKETSTGMPQVTSQTVMTSQSDASWLPTSSQSSSASKPFLLRTHCLVLAQILFWSIKTLTLHRDIGLT